jgi:hypothetical protein
MPFEAKTSATMLSEQGLAWHQAAPGADAFVFHAGAAMLELCADASDAALIYEVDALMQAMTTLRPQRVGAITAPLPKHQSQAAVPALAERHRHVWLPHVPRDGIDLSRGKRALVPGGRLHSVYQITLRETSMNTWLDHGDRR